MTFAKWFIAGAEFGTKAFFAVFIFALYCIAILAVLVTIGTIIAMFHHDSEDDFDE